VSEQFVAARAGAKFFFLHFLFGEKESGNDANLPNLKKQPFDCFLFDDFYNFIPLGAQGFL
jgi:hypothetical protein